MALHPFANLPLKLVSLAIAAVLWLAVSGQSVVERNVQVPLEYQNVPPGLEIVGEPPGAVDVRLRGSSGSLARVQQGDVVAALNLAGARPGTRILNLRSDEVRVPFGVAVVQVTPPTVSLEFEHSGQKVVTVSPMVEGEPAPGFVVGQITSSPATVVVLGPAGRLQTLREATTEPVQVGGARRTLQDRVTIGIEDSALRLREPQVATVTVEVLAASVERTVSAVIVRAVAAAAGTRVTIAPAVVDARVRGSSERIAALQATDLVAEVDLNTLTRGRYVLPVRLQTRPGVAAERTEPATVTVIIR
ncbi:MAG: CdaR family protein [Luteitalea sp.]